ncbi:hypothetical protein TSMEX_007823 [Taenia solium]|eukprot:TsM_000254500 transcript=TsM_000254500 gene=TsM_000254500
MSGSSRSPSNSSSIADVLEEDSGITDLIRSAWNQMRFGWNLPLKPRLLPGFLFHFLGKEYFNPSDCKPI